MLWEDADADREHAAVKKMDGAMSRGLGRERSIDEERYRLIVRRMGML